MLPPLSILVPTYGRAHCVNEVLECFRRQEYDGTLELVILNDVQQQELTCSLEHVRIINQSERSPSLGDKRNAIVRLSRYQHFLFVDDDDIFLPWYAQTAMEAHLAWGKPAWPHAHFYASGVGPATTIRHKATSHPGSYLMTVNQFTAIGGYPFVYAGGDQILRSKAFKAFDCQPERNSHIARVGYVYRWNNNVYHISGSRDHATAWERTAESLKSRLDSGEEPSGRLALSPQWSADYLTLAQAAL
jgi:glycosyltransferase involved in cell wall biosynthesis